MGGKILRGYLSSLGHVYPSPNSLIRRESGNLESENLGASGIDLKKKKKKETEVRDPFSLLFII